MGFYFFYNSDTKLKLDPTYKHKFEQNTKYKMISFYIHFIFSHSSFIINSFILIQLVIPFLAYKAGFKL